MSYVRFFCFLPFQVYFRDFRIFISLIWSQFALYFESLCVSTKSIDFVDTLITIGISLLQVGSLYALSGSFSISRDHFSGIKS